MPKPRNVVREIAVAFLFAGVFAVGLYSYIRSSIPEPPPASAEAPLPAAAPGADDLQRAAALAARFVGELRVQRYDAAYALMSTVYRDAYSAAEFRASCSASPFLARAERSALSRTRRQVPPGADARTASLSGIGSIVSAAGSIDAAFTFLEEQGELRILVLSLAGIPVLDGVSGKR